jgi:hypothetical protein
MHGLLVVETVARLFGILYITSVVMLPSSEVSHCLSEGTWTAKKIFGPAHLLEGFMVPV